MTTLRTAAQQALEALEQSETFVPYEGFGMARRKAESKHQAAITALRAALAEQRLTDMEQKMERSIESLKAALAEPVQEPVAWGLFAKVGKDFVLQHPVRFSEDDAKNDRLMYPLDTVIVIRPLYTAPPQRKPLSEEDIKRIDDSTHFHESPDWSLRFARAVERAHEIT